MAQEIIATVEAAGGYVTGSQVFGPEGGQLALLFVTKGSSHGAILHYENPPAHQIGTQALSHYSAALGHIENEQDYLSFLVFSFAPDAVHAGGDLKETLAHLERGAGYDWADARLIKASALYSRVSALAAQRMRIISLLAGGAYYGGSAEIALWADHIISDSRASICMAEATIGLIPGWCGIARLIKKAGVFNARYLCETAYHANAHELQQIGVVDRIVDLPFPLHQRGTKDDAGDHARRTLTPLIAQVLAYASVRITDATHPHASHHAITTEDLREVEVELRSDPYVYQRVWGLPVKRAEKVLGSYLAPLAPQSIEALRTLFIAYHEGCSEAQFARTEMFADMQLYRHPLLAKGIRATLAKRVPRFILDDTAKDGGTDA